MLIYIVLFFILSSICVLALVAIMMIRCLGLIPLAKNIVTKLFSHKYDQKFS